MVHLQLLGSDEPVLIIQSDSVDTEKIKERNAEYPAVSEEETYRYHGQWHINVCQYINPDDAVPVEIGIYNCWPRDSAHSPIRRTSGLTSMVWVPTLIGVHRTSKSSYSISLPLLRLSPLLKELILVLFSFCYDFMVRFYILLTVS